ncbi:MAG: alpha/beta hydrolase, partial [Spirulinaceae cyanobacterium]
MLSNPEASGFTVEPFAVPTADGVVLQATLLTPTRGNPRGTILMLHGISARKEQNLAIATRLVSAGYRCILYDSRAHGESGGEFVSYGWREVADAQAVIDAAIAQFEQPEQPLAPFGLFGRSLGASVGLQLLPEEPRLQSAVLVSPFSRLEDVMAETAAPYLGRWGAAAVLPLVSGVMRWRTGGFESGWEQGFELGFNP